MKVMFLCFLIAVSCTSLASRQDSVSEVHKLFVEDQIDRGVGDKEAIHGDAILKRDEARRARVHQLLEAGSLKTADDFHDAAFIFQHGQTPDDYLFAHVLAIIAVRKGDNRSLWVAAATLDRYLGSVNQPQIFGTQFHSNGNSPYTQEPYNRALVPDQLREILCVPSIEQQKLNLSEYIAGRWPTRTRPLGCAPERFP